METFVLLPFFLLSRVPTDDGTWRHGPEYTFVLDANMTILEGSVVNFSVYEAYSTLKCRPRDFETLHCQLDINKIIIHRGPIEVDEKENSWLLQVSLLDIKFDRRGIRNLVIFREMNPWYLDVVRAFVSQMNFGVELLHKPDGAFKAEESIYFGQCESLVNISRVSQSNEVLRKEDYEIVPVPGLEKNRGEVMVIDKTRNMENCIDKRDYIIMGEEKYYVEGQMLSSRSRIEISDTGLNSYTENMVNFTSYEVTFSFYEKVSMNLVSILPAEEALEPCPKNTETVSLHVYSKKD